MRAHIASTVRRCVALAMVGAAALLISVGAQNYGGAAGHGSNVADGWHQRAYHECYNQDGMPIPCISRRNG